MADQPKQKKQKPYAAKCRRGERPYMYSDEYGACKRNPLDGEARSRWMAKFSPQWDPAVGRFRGRVSASA